MLARPSPPAAAVLATALLASCQTVDGPQVRAAYLQVDLKGEAALGPSGGGTPLGDRRVDLQSDLGLDSPQDSVLLAAVFPTSIGRFGLSTFWFDQRGTGTLSNPFGDIAAGSTVATEASVVDVKGYWVYDVVNSDVVRLAPGVALQYVDVDVTVRDLSGGTQAEGAATRAPLPLLFLDGDLAVGPLFVSAQGGGMVVRLGDADGVHWDFEGRVGFQPTPEVELFAGYRFLNLDATGTAGSRDAEVDVQLQGWFLGGGLRF